MVVFSYRRPPREKLGNSAPRLRIAFYMFQIPTQIEHPLQQIPQQQQAQQWYSLVMVAVVAMALNMIAQPATVYPVTTKNAQQGSVQAGAKTKPTERSGGVPEKNPRPTYQAASETHIISTPHVCDGNYSKCLTSSARDISFVHQSPKVLALPSPYDYGHAWH